MIERWSHFRARPAWKRFAAALSDPDRAQMGILQRIVARNKDTRFGRAHHFPVINHLADYQEKVPISTYETLAPWLQATAEARSNILTSDPVIGFQTTGGTTYVPRLIPITESYLNEWREGRDAWFISLSHRLKGLSPQDILTFLPRFIYARPATMGGIPIGGDPDPRLWMHGSLYDPQPSTITDGDWPTEQAARWLMAKNARVLSMTSPHLLHILIQTLRSQWERVLDSVEAGRRRELDGARDRYPLKNDFARFAKMAWPRLQVISCWQEGSFSDTIQELLHLFPNTMDWEAKGVIAAEGLVTLPFEGNPDPTAAITSHFLEFIDLERPYQRPRLLSELKVGGVYSPILTTSAGLYRYHLQDVLFCAGRNRATPTFRYRGKIDQSVDLVGEKLTAAQVERAYETAVYRSHTQPKFFFVAPDFGAPLRYRVFIENDQVSPSQLSILIDAFEDSLMTNQGYSVAMRSGQIAPLEAEIVENGLDVWLRHSSKAGESPPLAFVRLDGRRDWREVFQPAIRRSLKRSSTTQTTVSGSNEHV